MEVLSGLLCDAAEDYNGKLCIMGAFDTLMSDHFPVAHPHCAIALRLLFRANDEGRHEFGLRMIDSDGNDIVPEIRPVIDVKLPDNLFFLSRNLVLNLQGLPFRAPGQYSIDITMDGEIVARIPLQVLQVPSGGFVQGPAG